MAQSWYVKVQRFWRKYLWGRRIKPQELRHFQASLLDESRLDLNFIVLSVGSCAIATFGLLSNSAAVIIGAMIIAPLMLPIRGIAFAALEGDLDLFRRGMVAVAVGTAIGVSLAAILGFMVNLPEYSSEVLARSRPTLLDLGIAVAAGGISGFAKVQPKVSNALAGTAIAVALMPPVCVIGLGLAQGNWQLSWGASLLYLTNLLGITLSCMVAFLIAGYIPLARARRGLGLAMALTGVLLLPLGITLARLVQQVNLEYSLQRALLDRTITFQRTQLLSLDANWLSSPPEVRLVVIASEPLTPNQVKLLEDFVEREMDQPFRLIFEINQVQEVRRRSIQEFGQIAQRAFPLPANHNRPQPTRPAR
ncbi:MAG: DUF389 domain-containing protein [Synechococcales cyanobacterium K44_A2020_017]|nr:DUF389 domain-containing protein [Synechococcales cyanobacterium K32_A2020_035]MBF2093824.1 DUF389 domain-containing protein [Synechococcales cyanobacterium K44_A2020_017]